MHDAAYQVSLDVFEGPLDLLLHLVRKHELDILDIPIAFVTEKYLEYLDAAGGVANLDIDVAGEYLVMAATLCHIKSRELLPDAPRDDDEPGEDGGGGRGALGDGDDDDDDVDPRADLIRRLLEYQKYKDAALQLGDRPVVGRNVWSRGATLEEAIAENVDADAVAPLASFPVHRLIEALDRLMRKAKIRVTHDVLIDRLSVSQRISELTDRLEREGRFTFTSMFAFGRPEHADRAWTETELRHEAVVTFLAMLEMAKLRLIAIHQEPPSAGPDGEPVAEADDVGGEIWIARAADDLRAALAGKLGASGTDDYR